MSWFPKAGLAGGFLLLGLGVASVLVPRPESPRPPFQVKPIQPAVALTSPFPSIGFLSAPWAHPPVAAAPPAPASTAPPPAPARSGVTLLGSLTSTDGRSSYFFKVAATGTVLILSPGVPKGPWTLVELNDQHYVLKGPGGVYDIPR